MKAFGDSNFIFLQSKINSIHQHQLVYQAAFQNFWS